MLSIILLSEDHGQAVVDPGVAGIGFQRLLQHHLCFGPAALLPINVAEILECNGVAGIQPDSLLQSRDRLFAAAFLGRQHSQVVPGIGPGVRVTGPSVKRPFETRARFFAHLFFEVNRPQQVASLGILGLLFQYKPTESECLVEVPSLQKHQRVGEMVSMELIAVPTARKRQRLLRAFSRGLRNLAKIDFEGRWIQRTLVDLDDQTLGVDQKGRWNTQIATSIEKIAIENIVNCRRFLAGEQDGERVAPFTHEVADRVRLVQSIQVNARHLQALGGPMGLSLFQQCQVLFRRRRRCFPEMKQQRTTAEVLELLLTARNIGQGEFWGSDGSQQPGFRRHGKRSPGFDARRAHLP